MKAVVLASALVAGAAEAAQIVCVTQTPSSRDWVPDQVLIELDSERLEAAVLDEFTLEALGGPVRVQFKQAGRRKLQLSWELVGATDRQGRKQNVNFRMTLNMARGTFTYNGIGESFYLAPGSASGRCAAVPNS
ncbi:MAG: hypothetical protein AAGF60_06385 [Pseudomonadota bacterium]